MSQTKLCSNIYEFSLFRKNRRDTNISMMCFAFLCAHLEAVSVWPQFRSNMYGLARLTQARNCKRKAWKKVPEVWQSPYFLTLVRRLQHTEFALKPEVGQACHYSRRISFMVATRHEPVCGAGDHKPVCPGDFTPTGIRGMDMSCGGSWAVRVALDTRSWPQSGRNVSWFEMRFWAKVYKRNGDVPHYICDESRGDKQVLLTAQEGAETTGLSEPAGSN